MSEKSAAVELFGDKTLNQTIEISKTNPEKTASLHMRLQGEMARNTYSDLPPTSDSAITEKNTLEKDISEKIEQLKAKERLLGENAIEQRFKN